MLIYFFRLLNRTFSDQTPEGIKKADENFKRDISGLNISVVAKGVGYIILGVLVFLVLVFIFTKIFV